MAVTNGVSISFSNCPGCEEDYQMLIEILFNTADNIDRTLRDWGFDFSRRPGSIDVILLCGGVCSFSWSMGLATINHWNC